MPGFGSGGLLLTAEVWIQYQSNWDLGFVVRKEAQGHVFLMVLLFSRPSIIVPMFHLSPTLFNLSN